MTDLEFMASLEDGTLDNKAFHHADHVRMAFLFLRTYSLLEALERFSTAVARFAAQNGKPELYHETMTWGFMLLIHDRITRGLGGQSWDEFAAANADVLDWKNNILKKYYRAETLSSELARRAFLFPDRA